jgi:formylglycine-generating enzyme required for sulfatase activity
MDERPPLDDGPTIIEPVAFRSVSHAAKRRRSLRRPLTFLVVVGLVAVALAVGWFAITAGRVELTFEPAPERVELTGPPPRLLLGGRYLLRPGTYTVEASLEGYHPLQEPFIVEGSKAQRFHFELRETPGVVALQCAGADDPGVPLADTEVSVDGRRAGRTPLDDMVLDPGPHTVRAQGERYRDLETEITVEGRGVRQTVTLELRTDWAELTIETRPVPTEVWLDGIVVASTPCRIDVASGAHALRLEAEGFEPWERELSIVAEEPLSFNDIVLEPARGRIFVETDPPGAQVMIDGAYAGLSPIEVPGTPHRDLLIQVAQDGFEPARRTIRIGAGESATVSFRLAAQRGTVRLEVEPRDAELSVDGVPWGKMPPEITLSAVEHRLEFTRDGYETEVRTVRPRPGVPENLAVELKRIARTPTPKLEEARAANGSLLVPLRPGTFTMGASRREQGRRANETLRAIRLERPALIGAREVTNDEFRAFRPEHDSGTFEEISLNRKDRPVANVTWDDAARFCNWLSARDGLPAAYVEADGTMRATDPLTIGYRLPTEAEWAYAARFDGEEALLRYPWGSSYPPTETTSGNFADESASGLLNVRIGGYDDGYAGPAPAGKFAPNPLGLFDTGGNVAEWCHDFYTIYTYDPTKVAVDPTGPATGRHHVVRGSSWRHASIGALRLSYRDYAGGARDDLGFRICRYLANAEATDDE